MIGRRYLGYRLGKPGTDGTSSAILPAVARLARRGPRRDQRRRKAAAIFSTAASNAPRRRLTL